MPGPNTRNTSRHTAFGSKKSSTIHYGMVNEMTAIKDRASLAQEPTSEEWGSDNLWQAVLARDRRFEADFVYGVRSTGIYCRCSCPSRRPKRQQVVFFSGHQAAEQEGFRACRRCLDGRTVAILPSSQRSKHSAKPCHPPPIIDAQLCPQDSDRNSPAAPLT